MGNKCEEAFMELLSPSPLDQSLDTKFIFFSIKTQIPADKCAKSTHSLVTQ